jgi:ABC-type nitrate/sulfonate/bicarbonate transport system substrate-binding protein
MKIQKVRVRLILTGMIIAILLISCNKANTAAKTAVAGDKPMDIIISHQPYSHGLPSYIAMEEDLFTPSGLNAEILWFTSGPAQNEALGADEWSVGAMGSPPSIAGGIAYNSKIIAFSVDDTASCDYWVRPDSEIAQIRGRVPGTLDILGDAASWRGKTILCPTATSAHFMLIATLRKLGLTENDVNIIHMDVPQAYTAFKAGQGDIVSLWDPQSFTAADEGWIRVSSGPATGEVMPTVIVASEKAIQKNPEMVYRWLKTYFQVCDKYRDNIKGQADYLKTMQLENGIQVTDDLAFKFVDKRPLPSLIQQKELFAGEYGARKVDIIMGNVIDFFVSQGRYEPADKEKLIKNHFIESQFVDRLCAEQGI